MKLRLKTVSPLRRGDAEKNKEVQLNPKVAVAHTTFKCVLKTLRLSVSAVNSVFLKTPLLRVSALNSMLPSLNELSLNERHFVDFPQRGDSLPQLLYRGFPQERHPFFPRRPLDLRRRPLVQNQFPDAVRQIQQLVNRRASPEPRPAAFETAGPFHHRNAPPLLRVQAAFDQHLVRILHPVLAPGAC